MGAKLIHGRGDSRDRTYTCWLSMRWRCNNPSNSAYPQYGGRGIKVCERWNDFLSFLEDMGECFPGLTIDRIDNEGAEGKRLRYREPVQLDA